jgi:SpoVK/Ycf46/Vps4 family AAA+-type ATPase
MSVSWDTFERYRQKGLDARRAGQWESAKVYLLEAARSMLDLSKTGTSEELKQSRRQMSQKLLDLAKDCERAKGENRRAPAARRGGGGASSSSSKENSGGGSGEDGETDASSWVVKDKPNINFSDVAGLESVKQDIKLKLVYPFEHPELAQKFGIRAGGGVLMYGPPGTGKTMLAKATAGEIDATFFLISPGDVLSKWVGEAEQNIKKLFEAASKEARSIIFIDEVEALVPARRDEGGSSVMQRVVPQILQGVEGFDRKSGRALLLMGATNVPWQLDPAMMRPGRFDEKVYIPLPDVPARRKMLDIYLGKRPVDPGVNLDEVADKLVGFSGADIKYVCDQAAVIPFLSSVATGAEGSITAQIIEDVIRETPKSVSAEMVRKFEDWGRQAMGG